MIKKGDNVRFLNAIGGGTVVRIDTDKKLVYVEDADGFEIPVLERECVIIAAINTETNFPIKDFSSKTGTTPNRPIETIENIVIQEQPIIETKEGEVLSALLAFFPLDIKQLQTTSYECYLLNDSNYFLYYNIIDIENGNFISVKNGVIEPNTQELITAVPKEKLSAWERIRIQLLPFKRDKNYEPQTVIDTIIKINTVKFYKLHSFITNDYFDEPAMLIDICAEKELQQESNKLLEITGEEIKNAMFQKESADRPRIVKKPQSAQIIEIDLHIHELLDSTAGMSNTEMLNCQLEKFHAILNENKSKKGQKIVFIHGKGEGVLRSEIEKQLKNRYKSYPYQDASFREYGFGATMVSIK
jgi:hypothetical protein